VITATKKIAPNPVAYATGFGYDAANRVITTSYPGGDVVTNPPAFAGAGSTTRLASRTACMRLEARW
jgi:hypothetical protein